jgi:hypothetical protein
MTEISGVHAITEDDICIYCLAELARGVPEDGKCGHEMQNILDRQMRLAIQSGRATPEAES